jgi:hypothetical protein
MARKSNNGPSFSKKPTAPAGATYTPTRKPLRIQKAVSKSAKTGNLKRWGRL